MRPIIVAYDPTWPTRFAYFAVTIRAAVGADIERIDHIGSTAVPGLAAKDVIDMQVTVRSLAVTDAWPDTLGSFQRRDITDDHVPPGAIAGPEWQKRYWHSTIPIAHLHVREAGRANQRYALLFRDYLKANPPAAQAYQRAKESLAALCDDTKVYAQTKDPICDIVMQAAEMWAGDAGWTGTVSTGSRS